MTDQGTALDSARSTVSTVTNRAVNVLAGLAIVVGVAVWSLFWSNLARVHYTQGDLGAALFTAAVFVAPAIAGLVWYVGESLDVDMPSPNVDVDITGS